MYTIIMFYKYLINNPLKKVLLFLYFLLHFFPKNLYIECILYIIYIVYMYIIYIVYIIYYLYLQIVSGQDKYVCIYIFIESIYMYKYILLI